MNSLAKLILKNNFLTAKSAGFSMLPMFQSGDVLYFQRSSLKTVKINDICLIHKNGQDVVHRIIYKRSNYVITKGDNNLWSDGKVYSKQIVGKVIKIKRNGSKFDPDQAYLLQSTLYFQEIAKIKNAFEKAKIDFVFLKGLPLHLFIYKTHPRRFYHDCDILISKNDYSNIQKIFLNFNYTEADTSFSNVVKTMQDKITEVTYYKRFNNVLVSFDMHLEVNMGIVQLGKINMIYPQKWIDELSQKFIQEKVQIKVDGKRYPVLSSANLITYLAIHFFQHGLKGIWRLEMLSKIYHRNETNKEVINEILKMTNTFRIENFLYPGLLLLKKYYPENNVTKLTSQIKINKIKKEYINRLVKNIRIFDDDTRIERGVGRFKNLYFLSPNPWWKKMWVFMSPQVIYTIFWVAVRKIRRIFFLF